MAPWYLFNSITRKISSTNVVLKYLLLEAINKKLDKEKVQFDYLTNLISGVLIMHSIKVMAKFNSMTH